MSVLTFVFADDLLGLMEKASAQLPATYLQSMEQFKLSTERTLPNILGLAARALFVAAGGTLGLLAAAPQTGKTARMIFCIVAAAAGAGLLFMQTWVSAAAFIIGGFLILLDSNREKTAEEEASSQDAPPQP